MGERRSDHDCAAEWLGGAGNEPPRSPAATWTLDLIRAVAWVVAIAGVEWWWRRRLPSRARAWQATAFLLLPVAAVAGAPHRTFGGSCARWLASGCLAIVGYPLGRALLSDRSRSRPPDGLGPELLGLGLLTVTEELIWGRQVEPVVGPLATAGLFALKHPTIDGRWRRVLGLALFWTGLAGVRRHSWRAAMLLHVAANMCGVLVGHWSGQDQF